MVPIIWHYSLKTKEVSIGIQKTRFFRGLITKNEVFDEYKKVFDMTLFNVLEVDQGHKKFKRWCGQTSRTL